MQRIVLAASFLVAATVIVGCNKMKGAKDGDTIIVMKQSEGETLASVGNTKLSLPELREDFLQRQGSFRGSANLNTDKTRNDYIENQVMQEAMFKKAVELGYFDRPEVKREVKKVVVQRLVRDKLEAAQNQFVPTEEQMKEHYEKNQNFYNRNDAIKVAFISVPFGSDKTKTKSIAETMHKDAMTSVKNSNTKEFSRIAMKHSQKIMSVAKISVETNETDYLEKSAFETKFGANTFDSIKDQSNVGEIRPLIMTDNAFVIMMKTGVRKAISEKFEDAKPKITKRLAYESRNDFYKKFMDDLRVEYKINVNKELLAELSKDDKPPVANAVPGINTAPPAAAAATAQQSDPPEADSGN